VRGMDPLHEGRPEGTTVVCGCHGSAFDVTTGAVLAGPASEPVRVFEVTKEGEELSVGAGG